jgi:hypothetical protein
MHGHHHLNTFAGAFEGSHRRGAQHAENALALALASTWSRYRRLAAIPIWDRPSG